MAYKSTRAKQTDPNADTRVRPPSTPPVVAPAAPLVQNPRGGAPRVNTNSTDARSRPSGGGQDYFYPTPFAPPPPKSEVWHARPATVTPASVVSQSTWGLKDVAAAEPEITKQIQDLLWSRYQAAPEAQRSSVFWQGVKQNPQLAAASFVRRMIDNMKRYNEVMNGEKPPTLSAAIETTMANSEVRQWLDWVRGNRTMPRGGV